MKILKTLVFAITLFSMSLHTLASEHTQCSLLVEEVEVVLSNEREVERFIRESEFVLLDLEDDLLHASLKTFMAQILWSQGANELTVTIADSRSGKRLIQRTPSLDQIRGYESDTVLSVTLRETYGNYEVGSLLYIGAKKVLSQEASLFCFNGVNK